MRVAKIAGLITTFLILFGANAQIGKSRSRVELDSLYTIYLDKNKTDSIRFKALFQYAQKGYSLSQPDSCLYFYRKLYHEAKEVGRTSTMATVTAEQATIHAKQGQLDTASTLYQKAIELYGQLQDTSRVIGCKANLANVHRQRGNLYEAYKAYSEALEWFELQNKPQPKAILNMNIGHVLVALGEHEKALPRFERMLELSREMEDERIEALAYDAIGNLHVSNNEWEEGLEYYLKALRVFENVGDLFNSARVLANIGNRYSDLNDSEKGLEFQKRGLAISRQLRNKVMESQALSNIALTYTKMAKNDSALAYSNDALSILMPMGIKEALPPILLDRSNIYSELGRSEEAKADCQMALELAESTGLIEVQRLACSCLYREYDKKGNYKKALLYHVKMLSLQDSLNNEDTVKKLQQFEFSEKQRSDSLSQVEKDLKLQLAHQVEVAKKDKTRNILVGGGLILLLLAGGLVSRNRYVNRSRKAIQVEKDRSEELLLNILPETVADELKDKGEVEAQLMGQVTVLFTDFKGFTAMSEQLSPKDLVNDLDHCFSEFDRITAKYGIEKIKTIGDAYMAAGGLPTPNSTHASDVIKAALEMRNFVEEGKIRKLDAGLPFFEIRIGVNTGPVVAGIVGVKKFQYDIWGDTVNTAARMESSGEIGKVNISEDTYTALKDDAEFIFESRGKIEAKGKGEIEMYFIETKL